VDFFDDPIEPLPRQGSRTEADEFFPNLIFRQRILKTSLRRRQITLDDVSTGEKNFHPAGKALFLLRGRIGMQTYFFPQRENLRITPQLGIQIEPEIVATLEQPDRQRKAQAELRFDDFGGF